MIAVGVMETGALLPAVGDLTLRVAVTESVVSLSLVLYKYQCSDNPEAL